MCCLFVVVCYRNKKDLAYALFMTNTTHAGFRYLKGFGVFERIGMILFNTNIERGSITETISFNYIPI